MLKSKSQDLINIYKTMVKIRSFEDEIARRWPEQEMRSPPHFYAGQEAIAASICQLLNNNDQVIGNYRGHGYYLAKNGEPNAFIAEMYCKFTGANAGKGGSMLLSDPKNGYMGSSAIVGGGIPIATGLALASKMRQSLFPKEMKKIKQVVVCFFGDAATEEGVFYESLNFAALKKLPILFVCENNSYAVTSHISKRQAKPDNIFKKAQVFGIPSIKIDGNNPLTIYEDANKALSNIRLGKGPYFIEATTYRWYQHVGDSYDDSSGLRTKKELEYWMKKDPIIFLEKYLMNKKIIDQFKINKIKTEVQEIIDRAFDYAKKSPLPKKEDLLTNVYA